MKAQIIKIFLLILILAIPLYNIIVIFSADTYVPAVGVDGSFGDRLSELDIRKIEKNINSLLSERAEEREQKRKEEERRKNYERIVQDINEGRLTFRRAFSDTLIVGDSLMNGLEIYNVLDKANMISMVSASLYHLEDNYSRIISNNPKRLVLHYGINMLTNSDSQLSFFISMYTRLIRSLKNDLPDTEIYVSGIFNVSEKVAVRYSFLPKYNEALKAMCTELGVGFVDNSPCLPADGSYYGSDGIHLSKSFYTDVWLPHLLYEVYA